MMTASSMGHAVQNASDDYSTGDLHSLPGLSTSSRTAITDDMTTTEGATTRRSFLMNDTTKVGMYEIDGTPSSYKSSRWRACCTLQNFCYCVQVVNCVLLCFLISLAAEEYPKIEALEEQVEADETEMANLQEEVRDKQQGQIQELNEQVAEQQQFNFLTLAGTFTLLTCLISVFHMSMHLQKMHQPKIQRKIIAMLWMSPIYSVTSFLTLWVPSAGGWMALVKDFYESYCIYTFLSFLIAVLGRGDRDQAVDVLAKHAPNLERPTRCLSCFYEPQPHVSDHAKANAVVTECQIYCLQFTFLRPLTTIIFVLMNRDKEETEGSNNQQEARFDPGLTTNPETGDQWTNNTGVRALRWLQEEGTNETTSDIGTSENDASSSSSSSVPSPTTHVASGTKLPAPSSPFSSSPLVPSPSPPMASPALESFATLAPSLSSAFVSTIGPTLAPIAGAIAGSLGNSTEDIGDNNLGGAFHGQDSSTDDLVQSTKAYFTSPGFALAMVVNVSVFIAFMGLLKFYHAVRDDLKWCRPWPKFLTIKGVVFVTFWQGLMILIFVIGLAEPDEKEDATFRATQYQNILICMEMLFFAITQWCVFPADEWEEGYQPKRMQSPGLGIKDFVSDVGHIVQNRSGRSRRGRRKITRRKTNVGGGMGSVVTQSDYAGLYHQPGTAAVVSSQYDGLGGPIDAGFAGGSFDDGNDDGSLDDSDDSNHHTLELPTLNQQSTTGSVVRFRDPPDRIIRPVKGGKEDGAFNDSLSSRESGHHVRDRSMSDGTAGHKADDELDSDLELL